MTAPSKVVGIDPGLSGAVAMLEDGKYKAVADLPIKVDSSGSKTICAHRVACLLRDFDPDLVVIELVNAMPRKNAKTGQVVKMGNLEPRYMPRSQ